MIETKRFSIPGSLYLKRDRYYYKYRFDGDKKPTIVAMKPPGQTRATKDYNTAAELAKVYYDNRTGSGKPVDGSLNSLLDKYDKYCDRYYDDPGIDGDTEYRKLVRRVFKFFRQTEGNKLASTYTSLDLLEYRDALLAMKKSKEDDRPRYCRKEINRRINIIIRFFKWAESRNMIPAGTSVPMIVMENIQPGRMGAKDHPKVKPVNEEWVDITCNYVPPVIRDMIRIMQLCGMRPKELCKLTGAQIDMSDDVWMIDYGMKHKTGYLNHERFVFFGPAAQEILRPYLVRDEHAPLFSPREAMAWRYKQRRKSRITPEHLSPAPKGVNPNMKDHYTTQTFRKAVTWCIYAAIKAGEKIGHWFPYQLRHAFGTKMDRIFGIETSAAAMGNNVETAKIYIEKRKEFAREAARRCG